MGWVTKIGYRGWTHARYTFRKGIQMEDSWVSRMISELEEFNTVTKCEFILRYRPHLSRKDVTNGGWGTSMWGSLVQSGIIQKTPYRRNREVVWVRGPNFDYFQTLRKIFRVTGPLTWDEIEDRKYGPNHFRTSRGQIDRDSWETFRDFFTRDFEYRDWVDDREPMLIGPDGVDPEDDNWAKYGKYD